MLVPKEGGEVASEIELTRSTEEAKGQQSANFQAWQIRRNRLAPEGETKATPPAAKNQTKVSSSTATACRIFGAPR